MPQPPIDAETQLRIAELAEEGISVRAIARELGIAPSTVARAGKRMGVSFDHSATAAATAARETDAKARRVEAALRALDAAMAELGKLRQPMRIAGIAGGNNAGVFTATLPRPTGAERLNIARIYRTYVDAHLRLTSADLGEAATDHARSLLGRLQEQLSAASDIDRWIAHMSGDCQDGACPYHDSDRQEQRA